MVVSGNNRHIALYADNGILNLGSRDFKEKYCEYTTNMTDTLTDIAW